MTPPAPNSDAFFDAPAPRVLAHRGLAVDAPENTLLAFLHALSIDVPILETDTRASRDGVAVLAHDPDLARLTGDRVRIADLSAAELAEVDLGEGQSICTLAHALDTFPDARFNIDIKSSDAIGPTVEAIREARATDRVLVGSFDERRRAAAVAALPGVATSASSRRVLAALTAVRTGARSRAQRVLAGIDAVQVPERHRGVRIVSPATVRAFHAAGVEVHVWTVNDEDTMHRLLDWGVDGLVTDRSDIAMRVLTERAG